MGKEKECWKGDSYKIIILNWVVEEATYEQRLEEGERFIYAEIRDISVPGKENGPGMFPW